MSLPVILSLIFATLLGLLPIFLLVGRRVIASRLSRRGERGPAQGWSESAILDRLIRERRETDVEPNRDVERMRLSNRQSGLARIAGASDASTRIGSPAAGSRIEARLARLSPLQRAVVYREILGPPIGLRAPGEHERY